MNTTPCAASEPVFVTVKEYARNCPAWGAAVSTWPVRERSAEVDGGDVGVPPVTKRPCENSDVSSPEAETPLGVEAVAVMDWPPRSMGNAAVNTPLPLASVIDVAMPSQVWPWPNPLASGNVLV